MKVLVLGGTGVMGESLVGLLAEQCDQIVVTSRSRECSQANVRYVKGNATDLDFVKGLLLRRWDVIVDFMIYPTPIFERHYKLLLGSTGRYIYLSSARVYAESEYAIQEDSPRLLDVTKDKTYLSTDEYALMKARQENILFGSSVKNWTIVRPYITYGDERLQLGVLEKEEWLYRALAGRSIVALRDILPRRTTLTSGHDVAIGINALIGADDVHCEIFNIVGSRTLLWHEVLDLYISVLEEHLNFKPKVYAQSLDEFIRWRPSVYPIIYDRLYDRVFNNQKINHYVDTSSFTDPSSGVRKCLENFLSYDRLNFKEINWVAEALKDRAFSERTPLSCIDGLKNKVKYFIYRNINFD